MINNSAYLYFYDDQSEYSQILHMSVLCASIAFKKVYLCVSESYVRFFRSTCRLPDNVDIYCLTAASLQSPLLARLDSLYESGTLRSNCPRVEKHCINRWLFLEEQLFFNEEVLFCLDWDTLVFPGIAEYNSYLQGVDLAATNLMSLGWNGPPTEPIWSLCPNLLYLSRNSLGHYTYYLNKYITYSERRGSIVAELFCDMQPWSSVISATLAQKNMLELLNFNDIADSVPLIDHNIRVTKDCGLGFKEMHYYFKQGTHTYLSTPYLEAKHIVFSDDDRPYFVVKYELDDWRRQNVRLSPQLREAAAIHFSGVEGKYLLLQTFIENLSRYLNSHIGHQILQ
jgi:hypothetical protein